MNKGTVWDHATPYSPRFMSYPMGAFPRPTGKDMQPDVI